MNWRRSAGRNGARILACERSALGSMVSGQPACLGGEKQGIGAPVLGCGALVDEPAARQCLDDTRRHGAINRRELGEGDLIDAGAVLDDLQGDVLRGRQVEFRGLLMEDEHRILLQPADDVAGL